MGQANTDFKLISAGDIAGVEGGANSIRKRYVIPVSRRDLPFFADRIRGLAKLDSHVGLGHYYPTSAFSPGEVMRSDVGVAYQLYLKHAEEDGRGAFAKLLN